MYVAEASVKRIHLVFYISFLSLMVGCSQDYSKHPEIVGLKQRLDVATSVKPLIGTNSYKIHKFEKNAKWVPGEILVRYKDSSINGGLEVWQFKDKDLDVLKVARTISKNRFVSFAEPNFVLRIASIPNDKYFNKMWHLSNAGAPFQESGADAPTSAVGRASADIDFLKAQDIANKIGVQRVVVVAVVDTGVDYRHLDLSENIWVNKDETLDGKDSDGNGYIDDIRGFNFYREEDDEYAPNDPMDIVGHGTHVAGIIAATGNNNEGIIGVAPQVKIMPLRAAAPSGGFATSSYVEAIIYAINNGANVINLSFGGPYESKTSNEIIKFATSKGVVVVAAAGNDASRVSFYPASQDEAISVVASDQKDRRAFFSNYGQSTDIAAPGTDIISTVPDMLGGPYDVWDGTSMAAPVVSGVAALLFATIPNITAEEVNARLLAGGENVDLINDDIDFLLGVNRVNAANSLGIDLTSVPTILRVTDLKIIDHKTKSPQLLLTPGYEYLVKVGIKNYWKKSAGGDIRIESESNFVTVSNASSTFAKSEQLERVENREDLRIVVSKYAPLGEAIVLNVSLKSFEGYETKRRMLFKVGFESFLSEFGELSTNPVPATIADFDLDGDDEVIFSSLAHESEENVAKGIFVTNGDGSFINGWPLILNKKMAEALTGDTNIELFVYDPTPPTIGDLNGDGVPEIVVPFILSRGDGAISTTLLLVLNQNGEPFGTPILITQTTPLIADINGDGGGDLILTNGIESETGVVTPHIKVVNGFGGEIFDLDLIHSDHLWIDDTLATGDLDGDGKVEIVTAMIGEFLNGGLLFVISSTGTILLEKELNYIPADLVLADLDSDGDLEIVLSTQKLLTAGDLRRAAGPLYAFHHNGSLVKGFPVKETAKSRKSVPFQYGNVNRVAIGDLDNDGTLEIVTSDARNELHAFHSDGRVVFGFPVNGSGRSPLLFTGAVLGDIDGDPELEIVVGSANNFIYAFNHDGTEVSGWPVELGYSTKMPPALGDVDGDGKTEVIATSFKSGVVVLKTPGDAKRQAWKQYRGDASHNGKSQMSTGVLINSIDDLM